MRIRAFKYFAADSLTETLQLLEELGPETKLLAGGTDLVLAMKQKTRMPRIVLSLHKVREIDFVRIETHRVRIGTGAKLTDVAGHEILEASIPILCRAVSLIGSWQIRNLATIGGNLCNASPAADSASPLLALDATAVIANIEGETEIPLGKFFIGPGKTVLKPNQILKEILVERPKNRSAGCYLKMMRKKAVDLALVGVALQAETDQTGRILARVRIGLGGVAPTPIRAPKAEAILTGLTHEEALKAIPEAARIAVKATQPITDIRASAEYRRAIVDVYVRRAAERILNTLFNTEGIQT